jgi:hypothetical protein
MPEIRRVDYLPVSIIVACKSQFQGIGRITTPFQHHKREIKVNILTIDSDHPDRLPLSPMKRYTNALNLTFFA